MNFSKSQPFTFPEGKVRGKKKLIGIILFIIIIGIIAFFDMTLAVGIILISFLTLIIFLILSKTGTKSKTLCLLFFIALLIHFGAVLFIHYAHFQPFSGGEGDYIKYDFAAQEIATRIHQGNFSLQGLSTSHYYPVVIGYIYALTLPEMLIGQLFAVWLAAISVLLVYLIVLEIGASKKQAFLIGLITAIYPSYLFFGSFLLKDTLVIPLILAGLLLTLKLIKNFSWRNFLIFYIVLGAVIHFRFYVGYALLFSFIPCWLLLCRLNLKKKFIYGIIIIILLGFLPQFFEGGYYGFKNIKSFLKPTSITFYREVAYNPLPSSAIEAPETPASETPASETPASETPASETPASETPASETPASERILKRLIIKIFPKIEKKSERPIGTGSSIKVKTEIDKPLNFLLNCSKSFIYVLLGPFPWQIRASRQLFVLFETIPWYFLVFFVIKGAFIALKRKRIALPLLVFSIISLGVLAIFERNFGGITRVRIPSFIALFCLIPLGFEKLRYIKIPFLNI